MSKTLGFPKNNIQIIKSQNLGKSYVLWPIPWNQIEASQLWVIDCFKKNSYLNFHEIGQKNLLLPRILLFMNLNVILWKRQSFWMFTWHRAFLNQWPSKQYMFIVPIHCSCSITYFCTQKIEIYISFRKEHFWIVSSSKIHFFGLHLMPDGICYI